MTKRINKSFKLTLEILSKLRDDNQGSSDYVLYVTAIENLIEQKLLIDKYRDRITRLKKQVRGLNKENSDLCCQYYLSKALFFDRIPNFKRLEGSNGSNSQ